MTVSSSHSRGLELFKKLGAADADSWAEREEESPALARWLFLTGLWRCVDADDDGEWMESWENDDDPIPRAIRRMLDHGIDPEDLTAVVRDMQIAALHAVCLLIDRSDHGIEDLQAKLPEIVEWRLAEYDGNHGQLGRAVEDLHEEFHDFDPTGRRGQPRRRSRRPRGTRDPG